MGLESIPITKKGGLLVILFLVAGEGDAVGCLVWLVLHGLTAVSMVAVCGSLSLDKEPAVIFYFQVPNYLPPKPRNLFSYKLTLLQQKHTLLRQ